MQMALLEIGGMYTNHWYPTHYHDLVQIPPDKFCPDRIIIECSTLVGILVSSDHQLSLIAHNVRSSGISLSDPTAWAWYRRLCPGCRCQRRRHWKLCRVRRHISNPKNPSQLYVIAGERVARQRSLEGCEMVDTALGRYELKPFEGVFGCWYDWRSANDDHGWSRRGARTCRQVSVLSKKVAITRFFSNLFHASTTISTTNHDASDPPNTSLTTRSEKLGDMGEMTTTGARDWCISSPRYIFSHFFYSLLMFIYNRLHIRPPPLHDKQFTSPPPTYDDDERWEAISMTNGQHNRMTKNDNDNNRGARRAACRAPGIFLFIGMFSFFVIYRGRDSSRHDTSRAPGSFFSKERQAGGLEMQMYQAQCMFICAYPVDYSWITSLRIGIHVALHANFSGLRKLFGNYAKWFKIISYWWIILHWLEFICQVIQNGSK